MADFLTIRVNSSHTGGLFTYHLFIKFPSLPENCYYSPLAAADSCNAKDFFRNFSAFSVFPSLIHRRAMLMQRSASSLFIAIYSKDRSEVLIDSL